MAAPSEKNPLFLSAASFWQPEWMPQSSAWIEHAPFAFWLVGELRPRTIVELGTQSGYSAMVFCQAIEKFGCETQLSAVDTWLGDSQTGFYSNEIFETLDRYHREKYRPICQLLRSTFDEARPQFAEGSIDLLHIDGLHTYEAVKHDFETWLPCVSDRGMILFHDIHVRKNDFGVWRLWEELRKKYANFEFQHGHGLGVLAMGTELPANLRELIAVPRDSAWADEIRAAYDYLGKHIHPGPTTRVPKIGSSPDEKFLKREQALHKEIKSLKKIIRSAESWQRRSWFTRAFHIWRAPALPKKPKPSLPQSPKVVPAPVVKKITNPSRQLNTIFSPAYYLSKNPAATASDLSPLEHYRTIGWKENFNPHPVFDVAWYLRQNPSVASEPLQHYLERGWKVGCAPHPLFDPVFYLNKYADVQSRGVEPLGHYVRWGWKLDCHCNPQGQIEWIWEFPSFDSLVNESDVKKALGDDFLEWLGKRDSLKPCVLLVTAESTPTGPPILLLNLAKKLRVNHQIILFDLCEGSLKSTFQKESDYYVGFGTQEQPRINRLLLALRILVDRCPIYFALVNSLASASTLRVLSQKYIPTVHLIHEYAVTPTDFWNIRNAVFLSGGIIFPSQKVLARSLRGCSEASTAQMVVLPPGLPVSSGKYFAADALRPVGWENATVIIAAGDVLYREGTDLFLICAEQLIKNNPAGKLRFVWIETGLSDLQSQGFKFYLEEQIQKIPVENAVCILEVVTDWEVPYSRADVFFLSSRGDTLPLAAQKAMSHGLPVVCFAEATAIADILSASPDCSDLADCVIPCLDLAAAGRQLQKLADEPDLRQKIGRINQQIAAETFDFEKYAAAVEATALRQVERTRREAQEGRVLAESAVLDREYFLPQISTAVWGDPIWYYIRAWVTVITRRKPFPGFHPEIYAEKNDLEDRDPLVHYLQSGRPAGPWSSPVIRPAQNVELTTTVKVALHIHLFYADMAELIARRLQVNRTPVDVFVSVPDEATAEIARQKLNCAPVKRLEIVVAPNRGRDIGPFLTAFGGDVFRDYDIVGHIHSKKSLHIKSSVKIEMWTDLLFENVIGGKYAMMDSVVAAMQANPQIGIVFPDDPNVFGWGKTLPHALELLERMDIRSALPKAFNFPAGTFFWARTASFQKLYDLKLRWEDYPEEPVPIEGTMIHAIERLFPIVAVDAGFQIAVSHVPGVTR